MGRATDQDRLEEQVPERFRLLEELGSGAFGVVYRAYDEKHRAPVALKTLHELSPRHLYRFKREFRSLANISHPNLVDLFELVADGEIWFFTMSHIDGVDFRTAMRHGRLSKRETESAKTIDPIKKTLEATGDATGDSNPELAETARAATVDGTADVGQVDSLADGGEADDEDSPLMAPPLDQDYLRETLVDLVTGVQALHDYGMIHRDLKPGNVMVTRKGRAVVLDFGLVTEISGPDGARPDDEDHSGITGTPRYLAPELAWDEPLDEAADWYAVGVMIYEILTGRPPYEATNAIAELYQKNENPPTPVEEYRPDVDTDLAEVCMDLLTIDPAGRPDGRELLDRLDTDSVDAGRLRPGGQARTDKSIFVGREDSLERLQTIATSTFRDERPSIVNIRGESGVGKSTLAEQFLRDWTDTRPETTVLRGRCYEKESVPYKALDGVIDELVPWLKDLPDEEVTELLGDGGRAVAQLFPVLKQVDAVFQADDIVVTTSDAQLRREAFDALGRIVRRISEDQPVIICIDDVQWGDEDSVLLLDHLLDGEDPPAVMLVTTWRDEDVEVSPFLDPFLEMQRDLEATVRVKDLSLSELGNEEVRQMARRIVETSSRASEDDAPPDIDFDRIVEESAGNPLFVDELSRHTAERGTFDSDVTEFDAILRERLDGLSDIARRILDIVSLAGQPLGRDTLRRVIGEDAGVLSELSMLRSERLVRSKGTDGDHLEPYHDRIRDALTERLADDEQRAIHLELAPAFESDPETVGFHLEAAGKFERAAEHLVEAADEAADALAFDRAAQLIERALEIGDWPDQRRFELGRRLGELHTALGLGRQAADAFLEASTLAEGLDVRECRTRAVEQLLRTGDIDRGTELLYEELDALGFSPAGNRAILIVSIAYRRWQLERRGFDFAPRSPDDIPRRQRILLDVLTTATTMFGVIDVLRGSYFHFHALPLALETGYPSKMVTLLCQQAAQDAALGRGRDRAEDLIATAQDLVPRCEHDVGLVRAFSIMMEGMLDYFDGNWRPALSSFERGHDIIDAEVPGAAWESAIYRFFETQCLRWLGRFDRLRADIPDFLDEALERGDAFHSVLFRMKMAFLALCDDAPDWADEQRVRAREEWTRDGYHIQDFRRFHLAVDTALYRGDLDAAWELVGERWGPMRRSLLAQSNPLQIHAWGLYGRVAAATLGDASGWRSWHARFRTWRAVRNLRNIGTNCADAFAGAIEAQRALSTGRFDRAAELLRDAETSFEAVGMAFHTHALRLRRAGLADGDEGDRLDDQARGWMQDRGIEAPDKMARLVVARPPDARLPAAEEGDAD